MTFGIIVIVIGIWLFYTNYNDKMERRAKNEKPSPTDDKGMIGGIGVIIQGILAILFALNII